MSAKTTDNREGVAADPLLQEFNLDEEDEPSQSSNMVEATAGATPGGPPQEPDGPDSDPKDPPKDKSRNFFYTAARVATGAVIGGVVAVGAVPVVLGAMGFTGAGIATASLAAKMMSAAAIANGGGVAAGSLVATLQSVGAAGLSMSSNVILGFAGSAIGGLAGRFKKGPRPGGPKAKGDQS